MIPEERHFSLLDAGQRVHAAFDAMGLQHHTILVGDSPCAALTELRNAQGTLLTAGWGKGSPEAATVGALYEALEHLLTQRHAATHAQVVPVESLIERLDPALTTYLPGALLFDQLEESIAIRHYTGLRGTAGFDYPVLLSTPDYLGAQLAQDTFDYTPLSRYSSNSGTAIGGSPDEALLHALNECIERDALSIFLSTHFFHRRDEALCVVSEDGLPADVAELHRHVSERLDAKVCLMDISTGSGITACLAVAHRCYDHARPYGAGASLNPAHAARRALHELLQSHLGLECTAASAQAGRAESPHPQLLLQAWPRLQPCAAMDIEARLESQRVVAGTLIERSTGPLAEQIDEIAASLQHAGLAAGYTVLHQFDSGITLINAVVPAFERFHLVTLGNVVVPGQRGGAPVPPS